MDENPYKSPEDVEPPKPRRVTDRVATARKVLWGIIVVYALALIYGLAFRAWGDFGLTVVIIVTIILLVLILRERRRHG